LGSPDFLRLLIHELGDAGRGCQSCIGRKEPQAELAGELDHTHHIFVTQDFEVVGAD
jgi:hypothetical protein